MLQRNKAVYQFAQFRLDSGERVLLRDGSPVPLTPKVFDILLFLVENRGRLVEKSLLMASLWPDTYIEDVTLVSNISDLRKALGEGENGYKFIQTVPKSGYRFVAEVVIIGDRTDSTVTRRWLWWAAAGMAVLTVASVVLFRSPTPAGPARLEYTQLTNFVDSVVSPALSADGRLLTFIRGDNTFVGPGEIYVQLLPNGERHSLPATESRR
jgi:DNA-binding winged helix-turn-helix (wHTH) protein